MIFFLKFSSIHLFYLSSLDAEQIENSAQNGQKLKIYEFIIRKQFHFHNLNSENNTTP